MTLYHVHDGDFEIRPNEPKLMIGVHFLEKKTQKHEKNKLFSTIGETVDYVIITHLLSCKICIVLQDSCKTGIDLQEACKNTMFWLSENDEIQNGRAQTSNFSNLDFFS